MPGPHEVFRAWRATTDAYATWRRRARELEALAARCDWTSWDLHLEGADWTIRIGPGRHPIVTVTMNRADDGTP